MDIARVFIVKIPEIFQGGKWLNKFQPLKAEKFGKIIRLIEGGGQKLLVDDVDCLENGLDSITREDYLLLGGSPLQMGLATYIAMRNTGGFINFLTWDRLSKDYIVQGVEF